MSVPWTYLLLNLSRSIEEKGDHLTGVKHEVKRIFESVKDLIKVFQVPGRTTDQIMQFMVSTGEVINKAEGFIDTYAKKVSEYASAAIYKKPIYWIELQKMRKKDLRQIRREIKVIREKFLPRDEDTKHFSQMVSLPDNHDLLALDESQAEEDLKEDLDHYYLIQCMFHFLLFPVNFEIPKRRLIALWIAEGLIRPKREDNETDEQIAERYLEELIGSGVVQIAKKKRNGEVKACKLNVDDFQREIWLSRAYEGNGIQDEDNAGIPNEGDVGIPRKTRLVDHNGMESMRVPSFIKIHGNPNISDSVPKHRDVVSFLSFDTKEESNPGEDIGYFLDRCILAGRFARLKVLDLEGVFRPKLPKKLGKLINLKYMGLRWTYLEYLPEFVNKLLNLQVLDVKHTYFSLLPRSIWKMKYLRHLYLNEAYRTRFPDRQSGAVSLNALQTLWGAFIDEKTCVTGGLDSSQNIRKLGLSCRRSRSTPQNTHMMSKQLHAINNWISKLKSLEILRLKSWDEQGNASYLHLSSLKGNQNLSTLYLFGILRQSVVSEFPPNLTDISLAGSKLAVDPMEFLGILQNLQYLRLLGHSVVHNSMHCSRRAFPKLKLLHIWKLENLEEWEVGEGSLPCLEELEIRSCIKLNMRHWFKRSFPQLKILRIWELENLEKWEVEEVSLPCLEELEIRSCNKLNKMHFSGGGFCQLKVLKIWKLENLKEWEIGEGSLLCLEVLEIRFCQKLNPRFVQKLPVSLTDITLSGSESDADPMQLLNRLPNLKYLGLLDKSVVCNKMRCSRGSFIKLKLLQISKLENLEEWEVEEGSLPSLEELEIRSCHKLKMLPDELQHVTTLKKLRLRNMPQTFIDQTKATQPQLWAKVEVATEVGKNNPN